MDILKLIDSLRRCDDYIYHIFTQGGCYRFHLFLKDMFPDCKPYINTRKDHVASMYNGELYDISGKIVDYEFRPMTIHDIELAKKWSFSKNNWLKIGECPNCEEPIIY